MSTGDKIFDKFFEYSIDLLCVADTNGIFIKLNPEWKKTLGYSISELEGKAYIDFVHPDDIEATKKAGQELAYNQPVENFINRYRHKDSSYRWLEWRSFPYEGKVYASVRDITKIKEAEEELKFFKILTDNSNDTIFWLNKNGGFQYVNDKACKSLGYTRDELLKLTLFDIAPEFTKEAWKKNWNSYQNSKNKDAISTQIESKHRRKDGHVYPVEVSITHFWKDGREFHISHVKDITERKQHEEAIKRSEKKYRGLFENMPYSFSIYRMLYDENKKPVNFIYEEINPASEKITGLSKKQLIGKSAKDLFPNTEDYWIQTFGKVARTGDPVNFTNYSIELDKYFEAFAFCPEKNLCAIILNDVTDRIKSEQALKQSEEKYRLLFENMTSSFSLHKLIYNQKGKAIDYIYEEVNPVFEKYTGLKAETVIGKSAKELFPNTEDYWIQLFGEVAKTGISRNFINYAKELNRYYETYSFCPQKGYCAAIFNDVTDRIQKEENLIKSEKLLSESQRIANIGSWEYIIDKDELNWNEQTYKIYGVNKSIKPNYKLSNALIHPDDRKFVEKNYLNSIKTGLLSEYEYRIIRPDNTLRHIKVVADIEYNPDKKPYRTYGIIQDITEQKEEKEALLKKQKLLNESQRIAKMGSWELNLENNIFDWSESSYQLFGFNKKNIPVTPEDFINLVYPDDRKKVIESSSRTLEKGRIDDEEFRILLPDGELKYIQISAELIKDEDSKPSKIAGVSRDITEKKKTAQALYASEQIMESLFRVAPAGMGIIKDRLLVDVNPEGCKISGYNKEELIGKDTRMLYLTDEEYSRVGQSLYNNLLENDSSSTETIWRRKDGEIINIYIALTPIDLKDLSKGIAFTVLNITERKQHEEALIKNQELLLDSQRLAKMGSWELDLNTFNLYWNKEAFLIYGYEYLSIEPTLELFYQLLHPDDLNFVKETLEDILISKTTKDFECRIITPTGELKYLVVANKLILGEQNSPVRLIGIVQDITEQKNKEKLIIKEKIKAEESEQRFKALHNASFGGITIHDKGKILDCNQGLSEITGYTIDELIGMDGLLLIAEKWRDTVMSNIQNNYEKAYEVYGLRKNGEEYPARLEAREIPYKGKQVRSVEFRDITEQKQVEIDLIKAKEKAEESEFFLQESQRYSNTGSYKLNFNTGLWISTETLDRILGIDDSYVKNIEGWLNLVHLGDKEMINQYFQNEIITNHQPFYKEYRIIRKKDNEIRWMHGIGKLYFDDSGNLKEMLGTIQDITERKSIEEERRMINIELERRVKKRTQQLQEANKDLEAFAYTISHDLRAPIRHINGFLELLRISTSPMDPKAKNYFDKISNSSKSMSVMIDELLRFSRLGRAQLNYYSINLNKIITCILDQFEPDFKGRNITWNIKELPEFIGDKELIKIAFENIISNAIKYTSKKEHAIIEIGPCDKEENNICIYIKDNGVGFDIRYKDKIFDVFSRLHKHEEFEGVGIGLANVQQIIKKHRGSISVESDIGKGTTFYIKLPEQLTPK